MSVVHCPPPSHQFIVNTVSIRTLATRCPRLILADEMNGADIALVVPIRGLPLILGVRGGVIGELQAMPVAVLKVLVEQSLVSTVKAITSGGHCL